MVLSALCVTEVKSLEGELKHTTFTTENVWEKLGSKTKQNEPKKQKKRNNKWTQLEIKNGFQIGINGGNERDYNLIWFLFCLGVFHFGFTYLEVPLMMHL